MLLRGLIGSTTSIMLRACLVLAHYIVVDLPVFEAIHAEPEKGIIHI